MRKITRDELKGMIERKEHFVLIDARTHEGFDKEHIPGANSIPADHMEKELVNDIKKDETIVTYCSSFACESSTIAAKKLEKYGYKKVIDFKGGLADWKEAGYPTEKT
jgi:rhodanese-related sulfurtransferase